MVSFFSFSFSFSQGFIQKLQAKNTLQLGKVLQLIANSFHKITYIIWENPDLYTY